MKLTTQEILDIFFAPESTAILAAVFGVSENTVRSIKRRRSHANITGQLSFFPGKAKSNRHILDDTTVCEIYQFSGSIKQLKKRFGISKAVANNIKFRYTYREVTESINELPGEIKLHKLSWDDVCTIRASNVETEVLAEIFNVSKSTINNIRSGRTRLLK
jgi:hypothetical protein